MVRTTNTEKAAARSARPAAHPGGTRLGASVGLAAATDALDAQRFRALIQETRFELDEEGGVRLVAALPALPRALAEQIHAKLIHHLTPDRALLYRAVDALVGKAG